MRLLGILAIIGLGAVAPAKAQDPSLEARNKEMKEYEYWCYGETSLTQCTSRIIRVDQDLKNRDAIAKRTGRPDTANRGLSLMGCYNYCVLRYFPADTTQECRTSKATFQRAARSRPALLKTDVRGYLDRQCRTT